MRIKDLVPLKVVVEDLCVSKSTLWRARQSNLPGFPEPTIIHRQVFWKKTELDALEDALLRFQGRSVFEQQRRHARRVAAIKKKRPPRAKRQRRPRSSNDQQSLF